MKTIKMLTSKWMSGFVAVIIILVASCQKDNDILNSIDTQNVNSEAASAAYVNEGSDISSSVINNMTLTQYSGARIEDDITSIVANKDGRLTCASVTLTRNSTSTKDSPSGTIVIDFGNGLTSTGLSCADNKGVTRKGKIIVTYAGRRWVPGSIFTVQFVDFYRNSAHIEGTERDSTYLSSSTDTLHLKFLSKLTGGKVTFGDGRNIERAHIFTKTWYRSFDPYHPENAEWHLEGNAWGKCKNGNDYTMDIKAPLIHKISCWTTKKICIAVKGEKLITILPGSASQKTYDVDYGDGTCDNLITVVTENGKEKVISVSNDGN